jgi:hypothetical protein
MDQNLRTGGETVQQNDNYEFCQNVIFIIGIYVFKDKKAPDNNCRGTSNQIDMQRLDIQIK